MARRFQLPPPRALPLGVAYSLAGALPALGLLVEVAWRSWSERLPYVLFFLGIAVSAWIGGALPGLVTVALSAMAAAALLLTSPVPEHVAHAFDGTVVFLFVGSAIALLAGMARESFLELRARSETLQHTENLLREAVRVRDDFISVASHELKTPITSMQLRLQHLLRRASTGTDNLPEFLRVIGVLERQTYRLGTLINNVLDVSRLGAGRLQLALDDTDLGAALAEAVAHLQPQIADSGAQVTVSAQPVHGRWDRTRIEQIIGNLLSNALKYGAGRPVHVSVEADGELAKLVVRDQGIGISLDAHARVFARFERATEVGSGLGVGLWLVREIVAAHGGAVLLQSAPGEGATFTVLLPVEPHAGWEVNAGASSLDPELRTAHPNLDLQHASIIVESRRLPTLPADAVWASLALLGEYVSTHFGFEERLMDAIGFPDLALHRKEHDHFVEDFARMRELLKERGPEPKHIRELSDKVQAWVAGHVFGSDLALIRFVRAHDLARERASTPGARA